MQAPMKLPYVLASALQIQLARQMMLDAIITGRLPYRELMGTLDGVRVKDWQESDQAGNLAYQNRLLNPRTRMHTPTNCTTSVSERLKSSI